jgi:hypothetical protein
MVQRVELTQQQVALDIARLQLRDFGKLGDRKIEHLLRFRILRLAQRPKINAPQQFVRFQVAHAPGAEVKLGQAIVQVRRCRVGIQGEFVLFDGARGIVLPAGVGRHFFVHVRQAEMVVGRGAIRRDRWRHRRRWRRIGSVRRTEGWRRHEQGGQRQVSDAFDGFGGYAKWRDIALLLPMIGH